MKHNFFLLIITFHCPQPFSHKPLQPFHKPIYFSHNFFFTDAPPFVTNRLNYILVYLKRATLVPLQMLPRRSAFRKSDSPVVTHIAPSVIRFLHSLYKFHKTYLI